MAFEEENKKQILFVGISDSQFFNQRRYSRRAVSNRKKYKDVSRSFIDVF